MSARKPSCVGSCSSILSLMYKIWTFSGRIILNQRWQPTFLRNWARCSPLWRLMMGMTRRRRKRRYFLMLNMLLDTSPMSHEIKTNDKPDRPWSFIAPKASSDGACIEMQMSYCYGVLVYGSYRVIFLTGPPPEFAKCWPVSNWFQKNVRVPDWPPLWLKIV